MAYKIGVTCKSCGQKIEVDDEYIQGVRAIEFAMTLYKRVQGKPAEFVNVAWQQRLTCGNPDCGKTNGYAGPDPLLYDG